MKYKIGTRIRYFRELRGLSQKEFASKIGVSNSRISNWEQGINRPDADILTAICKVLGISADDLLDINNTQLEEPEFTVSEISHIKKYRALDEHGKKIVDTVLNVEAERCKQSNSNKD